MISLNIGRESRESYTDQVVSNAVARAEGATGAALAAIEAAAGLWERGFTAGESPIMPPSMLAIIGRALLLSGESVWYVRGSRRPRFECVSSHDLQGDGPLPASWRYRVNIPGPSTTRTIGNVRADKIAHFRIGATVHRPWAGCSPLANSDTTRQLLANLETQLGNEASGPVGSIMPMPQPSTEIATDIKNLKGGVYVTESGLQGFDESKRAQAEFTPKRVGFDAPDSATTARTDVQRAVYSACGIPLALVDALPGAQAREAWRIFLHGTIGPIARIVQAEIARLGLDAALDFAELRASDVQGRARAYQSLTSGGMPDAEARRFAGVA